MTAHQFAKQLLAGPDLPILVPKVTEWDDSEDCSADPFVTEEEGFSRVTEAPCRILLITYRETKLPTSALINESKIENRHSKIPS